MATDEWIVVGRVARPHGVRGCVIVNPDTDFPDRRFRAGERLLVARPESPSGEEYRIVSARFHQHRPILELEGVESMSAAEALAGAELRLPMTALDPLPEGTFYHHQLVGCEVHDRAGHALGTVKAVEGPMERSRLVVAGTLGEILIPMTEGICVSVDPAAGRIVVDPPEGLVELNAVTPRP